ncbi:MAG TPA: hypothetical protein VFN51_00175 [Candidatus Saccharimonadales bacterium]|nr:hypothetical protein [Candidatus Saccharimonadales bacterium]
MEQFNQEPRVSPEQRLHLRKLAAREAIGHTNEETSREFTPYRDKGMDKLMWGVRRVMAHERRWRSEQR